MQDDTTIDRNWSIDWGRGWGPIKFGTPRAEVVEQLKQLDFDVDDDEGEGSLYLFDPEFELDFSPEAPHELLQIVVNDPVLKMNGIPLQRTTLDQTLLAINITSFEGAFWRDDDENTDTLPGFTAEEVDDSQRTTDDLIDHGTLWIPALGVGFGMWPGIVSEVLLRHPKHAPTSGIAPLTSEQLELAMRQKLPLSEEVHEAINKQHRIASYVVNIGFALVAIGVVLFAIMEQQKWNNIPAVPAKMIAFDKANPKRNWDDYLFEYQDQTGAKHQVWFSLSDIYVPREIGDEIEVKFLPEKPQRAIAPSQFNNIGMGYGVAYLPFLGVIWASANGLLKMIFELLIPYFRQR